MPLAINYYRRIKEPLHDMGQNIYMVASVGQHSQFSDDHT